MCITMNYLSKNLHYLRKKAGYTQAEVPVNTGISRTTWSNYENAVSEPDLSKLIDIANHFGVSLDDLVLLDMSENVHLIKKTAEKNIGKNVHPIVLPNVHPTQNQELKEDQTPYGNTLVKEVSELLLHQINQLNKLAEDVRDIKGKLP